MPIQDYGDGRKPCGDQILVRLANVYHERMLTIIKPSSSPILPAANETMDVEPFYRKLGRLSRSNTGIFKASYASHLLAQLYYL